MKYPLIWMFVVYLLGILGGQYCLGISSTVLFFSFSIILIIYLYKKIKWSGIYVFPLILLFGYIYIGISHSVMEPDLETFISKNSIRNDFEIFGKVDEIQYYKEEQIKCILNSQEIIYGNKTFVKPIKLQAYIKSPNPVKHGDLVYIKGELLPFDLPRNPGGWNELLYMKTRKIQYKVFGELIIRQEGKKSFKNTIYALRDQWEKIYDTVLPSKQSSVLKAMILGDRSELEQEQKIIYQKAGISHILAISGLHISILTLFLLKIFKTFPICDNIRTVVILLFLWFYCVLTGLNISTVRAVFMITVILVGKLVRRSYEIYTSIALAAFLVLINQPLYLWDAGFQLSFTAVLGLVFFGTVFHKIFWVHKKIRKILFPSIGVGLATLPIVSYHFYYVSTIGFLLNIMIIPLASIVVGFGFLGGVIGFFWIDGARFVMGTVYYILCFYESVSRFFINIPYSNFITGAPRIWGIIVYYIVIIGLGLYILYRRQINFHKRIVYCLLGICILLCCTVFIKSRDFEVVFLDVGQGDAIAVHTKNNINLLIDGGEKDPERVLLPYFRYKGIQSLDGIFLTHPDKDHILGLLGILEYMEIKKIFVSVEDNLNDEIYHKFILRAAQLGIPCYYLRQGDTISFDDVKINCLYPKVIHVESKQESWNDLSMVLQVTYKEHSFLLTGDIEKDGENNIVNTYPSIESDFLKVPHHGSKTSSTEDFLDWCNPKNAFISCGKNNRYSHPHKQILERYNQHNIPIITTADRGAILINSDGKNYTIDTMIEDNRSNEYETAKRTNQKKYIFTGILILWGGAVFKKILFRGNTEENSSF